MNAGIEMLIERLKTHPEDFRFDIDHEHYSTPWGDILKEALNCFYITEEEQEAVRDARLEAHREVFTHRVLNTLTMVNKPQTETEHVFKSYPLQGGTGLVYNSVIPTTWGGAGNTTTSLNIGGTTLTQEDFEDLKAAAEQWRKLNK